MKSLIVGLSFPLLMVLHHTAHSGTGITRDEYLAYCTAAASDAWASLDADRIKWKESIDLQYVFGYNPPGNDLYLADLYANLTELTGDTAYLEKTKSLLLYYPKYKDAYPAGYAKTIPEYVDGLPAVPNIFTFPKYLHAYDVLLHEGSLTQSERNAIEKSIVESADFFVNFQEWGPMNRGMLRAEALAYAAKLVPSNPHSAQWAMMGKAIGDESWGAWEIEDASGYNGIWLYSLLGYASDVREDESLYSTPEMHYYFDFYLQLISPAGFVPDFGDANWATGWERMIPFFEKGAAIYRDPRLRWAAETSFRKFLDPLPQRKGVFMALLLSDAARWADFTIPSAPPTNRSEEVLEDQVGKKVVFRNGWTPNSTYMLYTYRDEGDDGWLPRAYLRTTIPVEEEKMTHGHSDENSVCLLMKNGSVLLHDGGYRDYMPSGPFGAYRADYFHNRVVIRDDKITIGQKEGEFRYASPGRAAVPGQTMLGFFHNSGAYDEVRTRKIDFLSLDHFDMTRTRLINTNKGYEADRMITYVKDLDWFVVIDAVRFTRDGYLSMANLWHTRKILQSGSGWYDTMYDSLGTNVVGGNERLLICFPEQAHLTDGVEPERRYYQDEQVVYQLMGRHGYTNNIQTFVTILIPHEANQKPEDLAKAIRLLPNVDSSQCAGIEIAYGGKTYIIGAKLDLDRELVRYWRRPMYTYDSGKASYGPYETDAYHLFVVEDGPTIDYVMAGGVRIRYKGKVLHEQRPSGAGLSFDGTPDDRGTGKVRYWHGTAQK